MPMIDPVTPPATAPAPRLPRRQWWVLLRSAVQHPGSPVFPEPIRQLKVPPRTMRCRLQLRPP